MTPVHVSFRKTEIAPFLGVLPEIFFYTHVCDGRPVNGTLTREVTSGSPAADAKAICAASQGATPPLPRVLDTTYCRQVAGIQFHSGALREQSVPARAAGDVVWIVTVRHGVLRLVTRILVGRVTS